MFKELLENRNNINYANYTTLDVEKDSEALADATYFKCIKIISESIGKVGCNLMKDTSKGVIRDKDNYLFDIVKNRPNKYMSNIDFFKTLVANALHNGDAFALITRDRKGNVTGLYPINVIQLVVDNVGIAKTTKENAILVQYTCGNTGVYNCTYSDVIHLKGFTFNGIESKAIKNILNDTILTNESAREYQKNLFANGLTNKCVVQTISDIKDENKLNSIIAMFSNLWKNDNRFLPIPAGYNIQPLNLTLADSQFKELKEMGAKQIASAFGVPQFMLNDLSDTNNNSLEMSNLHFLSNCLMIIFKQLENELNYKLLTKEERKNNYFEFNINELLRVDSKTQQEIICNYVRNSIYTINDARKLLGMELVEGGDNMILASGYSTLQNVLNGEVSYINKETNNKEVK